MTPALRVDGLAMGFGATPVLADVDLEVPEHSITAVLGSSGGGKTTLLRAIAGFVHPDRGRIELGGRAIAAPGLHVAPERRRLGYVPQEGALFPHLTVARNVAFGLRGNVRRSSRVDDLLQLVGLAGFERRYPHELSGGQQQRVALARALAVRPRLILLDEPFSSLDAALRASVRADIAQLLRDAGTAVVLVTHDQQEALSMADQIAVLRDGRIAQVGTPRDVYSHPVDPDMAAFLGAANLVPAQLGGGRAVTPLGVLDTAPQPYGPGTVLVRPEQITITSDGLPGRVLEQTYLGHGSMLLVDTDAAGVDPVRVRIHGIDSYAPGNHVHLEAAGYAPAWQSDGPQRLSHGPDRV